jgi:formylglycine-generating enzyme required for sulfatase activity
MKRTIVIVTTVILACGAVLVGDNAADLAVMKAKQLTVPKVDMKMMRIPAGSFIMGSPKTEQYRSSNETQHKVTITRPFYMGACEVTQKQYYDLMLPGFDHDAWQFARGPIHAGTAMFYRSRSGRGDFVGGKLNLKQPMECVTWEKAREFCRKVTDLERKAGRLPKGYIYRLPTEAEWEYACRAGAKGRYNVKGEKDTLEYLKSSKFINSFANVAEGKPVDVAQKKPNAWGLYDMHGNVYEWCLDWYGPYSGGDEKDPIGPATGIKRVARGGSFNGALPYAPPGVIPQRDVYKTIGPFIRSASRYGLRPDVSFYAICGFRVVLGPEVKVNKAPPPANPNAKAGK